MSSAFLDLAEKSLDTTLLGSVPILRRFYKAFLVVDECVEANASYLPGTIAWGLSPPVLELDQARTRFLADGFPEVVGELAVAGVGKTAFERLLDLSQIHRPLAALVVDAERLSAEIKSFGLLHYLGPMPPTSNSLAVQALLRDERSDDDENIRDIVLPCEERDLVIRVLRDYQQLHPFAHDGLRILAVNVMELQVVLAGTDSFLEEYLKNSFSDLPPFHCVIKVYSTSSSPMVMESRLTLWRNHVVERQREKGRPLILTVGHHYAPKSKIIDLLKKEKQLYDITFLFHFLRGSLSGKADPTKEFEFNFDGWNGLQFPITEYPRPIKSDDRYRRQCLLSNRRLRIQTRHADLSARLRNGVDTKLDHVIFGQVDYKPWEAVVERLHEHARWVACIDPYVDKRLLCNENGVDQRKIVGFVSGLGAYGELNLSISTEQDTLKQLTDHVSGKLTNLMPFEQPEGFKVMASRVVVEAEEIIGMSSLRAVVGDGERIREVLGFAAIRRLLTPPSGQMSQLLPLDSLQHWFSGSKTSLRPDLLLLTLEVRANDIPLVHAVLIECKFAQKITAHLAKAIEQIHDGLQHLAVLLAPDYPDLQRLEFDRRYWWAQLHRAMTSRSVVNLPDHNWRDLDHALERLAEGQYEIRWQCAILTFWTNEAKPQPEITPLELRTGTVPSQFHVQDGFSIEHIEIGYKGVSSLFADTKSKLRIELKKAAVVLRAMPKNGKDTKKADITDTQEPMELLTPLEVKGKQQDEINFPEEPLILSTIPNSPIPTPTSKLNEKPDASENSLQAPTEFTVNSVVKSTLFQVPEKILIGTRNNKEPVYWYFGHPQLPNRHILIFGASGSGKTYGIQCLLAEMAQQELHSLIVDYTDGFLPGQLEEEFKDAAKPKYHYVKTEKLPLNPFRRQMQIIDPSIPAIEESSFEVATRIASIFTSVYQTMGDQQAASLIRVLEAGIEESDHFSLDKTLALLREDGQSGESLANKVEPLVKSKPFRDQEGSAWDEMLQSEKNWAHVLQLKGLALDIQKMITEFVLWDLWDYAQNTGSKNRPIPIVLDEIQNLDHSSDSPIDKMLREGRKFGLSMILATQTTSQFNQEQRDRLFQAGHKLFFKPATTEVDRFATILSQATSNTKADWKQRLANLEKGQCWSLGPALKSGGTFKEEAILVNVTPLEQRSFKGT